MGQPTFETRKVLLVMLEVTRKFSSFCLTQHGNTDHSKQENRKRDVCIH